MILLTHLHCTFIHVRTYAIYFMFVFAYLVTFTVAIDIAALFTCIESSTA